MPLVYALAYTGQIARAAPTRTAPDILRDIFGRFQAT